MELRTMKMSELKPSPANPRQTLKPGDEDYESLKRSLDQFGYVEPIVWNERSGHVVGGHQRVTVLKEQGVSEVEVSVVDLSDAEERLLCLALNRVGGRWDRERLQTMLVEMTQQGVDLEATGFTALQVSRMVDAAGEKKKEPMYDLGLAPLEHYDFIMVVFEDARDWLVACNKLGIKKVRCERRHEQVGIGRVVKGTDLLNKLK
jgi:hypothetical protein